MNSIVSRVITPKTPNICHAFLVESRFIAIGELINQMKPGIDGLWTQSNPIGQISLK